MIFPFPDTAYKYRPLKQGARGNDVIALQYALGIANTDGIFGNETGLAVRAFQDYRKLTADGIAGVVTQRELCLQALWPAQKQHRLPAGLSRGMIEGESAFQVGNQSVTYVRSGVRKADLGPVQFSTTLIDEAAVRRALNVPAAIGRLCAHLREKRDEYAEFFDEDFEAEWRLACGSWNAPAWTDLIARGKPIAQWKVDWVNNYVASKVIYVTDWS